MRERERGEREASRRCIRRPVFASVWKLILYKFLGPRRLDLGDGYVSFLNETGNLYIRTEPDPPLLKFTRYRRQNKMQTQ